MKIKKVCIVTASRSEYGLLRWVINDVYKSSYLELQLIVTGGHLSKEQGYTYKDIEADGYPIAAKVNINVDSTSQVAICKTIATCIDKIADVFNKLKPDVIIVLGDRYELLPICSTALIFKIPIAHIAGGDITEGAIDNCIRNAITMMATYHFPGTEESKARVVRMLGYEENVFVVGETNIDNFCRISIYNREVLSKSLNIDSQKKWVICTYHPETRISLKDNIRRVDALCDLFTSILSKYEIIITKANIDYGGKLINDKFQTLSKEYSNVHLYSSLGQNTYINLLYNVDFMIGNSSSGIYESPFVGIPCINIGNRQAGRYEAQNILTTNGNYDDLIEAINTINSKAFRELCKPNKTLYGDGHSSERIIKHLISTTL